MIKCNKDDCYWQDSSRNCECAYCIRNQAEKSDDHKKNEADNYISVLDKVRELYEALTEGELPEGVNCELPKLSETRAFELIWFLQEVTCCLPSHIEQCDTCKELYDSEQGGFCLDDEYEVDGETLPKKYWGHYCEACAPCVDFRLK